jgi:hypothetical protein
MTCFQWIDWVEMTRKNTKPNGLSGKQAGSVHKQLAATNRETGAVRGAPARMGVCDMGIHFRRRHCVASLVCAAGIVVLGHQVWRIGSAEAAARIKTAPAGVPVFELDPSWPKPLPNHWVYGLALGVSVDSHGNVWFVHMPTGTDGAVLAEAALAQKGPAPPVLEFDREGNVVQAWGGPGFGYSWPQAGSPKVAYPAAGSGGWAEHDLFVDYQNNVWIVGNGHVALKFTPAGKFLLQLGELWKNGGSNDTRLLGNPTSGTVDQKTNEVYISDGYTNRRIIVFDGKTGAYKRHWGAYGKRPEDDPWEKFDPNKPPPRQLQPSHCVQIAKDGLVYVCDRERNRIQVFKKDGTFVKEAFVAKETDARGGGGGSVGQAAFSVDPEQRYLYIADHTNSKIWILRRSDLEVLSSFDTPGSHGFTTDSKGNLYTSGPINRKITPNGPRKYVFKGLRNAPNN